VSAPLRRELGLLPLVAIVFFNVSGGPYGIEDAVSSFALLLTNSRLPYVLALDGQMPARLAVVHPRFGTPWVAVAVSSACYSLLVFWDFKELIVLNIWLYSISLLVELAAFVALRFKEPGLARPWRVGGGAPGMWVTAGLPSAVSIVAMATAGWLNTTVGAGAALTGPAIYAWWRRRGRRTLTLSPSGGEGFAGSPSPSSRASRNGCCEHSRR